MVEYQSIIGISTGDYSDSLDPRFHSFLLLFMIFNCCLGIRCQVGKVRQLYLGSIWFGIEILIFISDRRQVGHRLIAFCHLF